MIPLIFASAAIFFALWPFTKLRIHTSPVLIPLLAMAAWARHPDSHAWLLWAAYATIAFLSAQLFGRPFLRTRFLQLSAALGGAYAAFACIWPGGFFNNRNHHAAFIELLLPIACWQAVKLRQPIYAAAAALMLISVVISASRAGIVLATAELLFIAALALFQQQLIKPKAIVLAGAITVILIAISGTAAWQRFGHLASDARNSTRHETARASIAMVRDRPWRGYGLGTWEATYPHYAERDIGFHLIHADNDWLEWTAEGGLPFLAMLLILGAFALKNAWAKPWSIGLTAVLLHALTEFPLQKPAVMSLFVVLLVCAEMASRKHASYSRATAAPANRART